MGRVINMRKSEYEAEKAAHPELYGDERLRPNPQIRTGRRFSMPETMYSDWHNALYEDKPYVNWWFEIVHDWYARNEEGYEPYMIRAQQTPIDWKSKIGNSDMSTNFKVEHTSEIYKGDYVIREDGTLYLLNWNVQNHANNQATQCVECNDKLNFMRAYQIKTDRYAYKLPGIDPNVKQDETGKNQIIVEEIPASHALYTGRPDYSVSSGMPGINSNDILTVSVQWNSETQKIRIDDTFKIGLFTYRVVDIVTSEIHIDKKHGVLQLFGKRVAGGVDDEYQ